MNHPNYATLARTPREQAALRPATAKDVGVRTSEGWPYGPNISSESRVLMAAWARRHGVRLAKRAYRSDWIAGRNNSYLGHNPDDWEDHPTGWCINRKRAIYVTQPYPRSEPYDEAVAAFADKHGLRWLVDPDGGWYGFGTVFIAVWDPDVIAEVTA